MKFVCGLFLSYFLSLGIVTGAMLNVVVQDAIKTAQIEEEMNVLAHLSLKALSDFPVSGAEARE